MGGRTNFDGCLIGFIFFSFYFTYAHVEVTPSLVSDFIGNSKLIVIIIAIKLTPKSYPILIAKLIYRGTIPASPSKIMVYK
jgi:hypothetical protein